MPISISTGGVAGITVETDPTALKLTGGTLSGKLNALTTATSAGVNLGHWTGNPSTMVAGDIWIVDRLNFTNRLGNTIGVVTTNQVSTIATSASTPILGVENSGSGGAFVVKSLSATAVGTTLRIENRGTGHSFVVEDTTTPDSSPFVITSDGSVAVGTLTPVSGSKLSVFGNTTINGTLSASNIQRGDVDIVDLIMAESSKEYLAQNLAPKFSSWSLSGGNSSVSFGFGEIEFAMLSRNNGVWQSVSIVTSVSTYTPISYNSGTFVFDGDISDGGNVSEISFSVGAYGYNITTYLT